MLFFLDRNPARADVDLHSLRLLAVLIELVTKHSNDYDKRTDEHCFEWLYGGQYLRDRHVVTGAPKPYAGETLYYFDASSKSVQYLYINVLGGASRGSVVSREGVLEFPEDKYSDGEQEQTYRSSWTRDGDDAYFVLTEVRAGEGWKEAWRIRMERQK